MVIIISKNLILVKWFLSLSWERWMDEYALYGKTPIDTHMAHIDNLIHT